MRKNNHTKEFYIKKYKEMKQYAEDKGINFPFKSVRELESTWKALKEDGVKQIDRSIKYGMQYNTDYKTALAEYKVSKELGLDYSFKKLKTLTTTEFAEENEDAIMQQYEDLKKQGMSGRAAGLFISTYWFGSE